MRAASRFPPHVAIPGLETLLRGRVFAAAEPDTLLRCRVLTWRVEPQTLNVLLSPDKGDTGIELAKSFDVVASQYMVELVSRRCVTRQDALSWYQHWPARRGAPSLYAFDKFEHVQLRPARGTLQTQARVLVDPAALLSRLSGVSVPGDVSGMTLGSR